MARQLLTRIYLGRRHPGRIHGLNRETGRTYCDLDPGSEVFEGPPSAIACDRCWSEQARLRRPREVQIGGDERVIEHPLVAAGHLALFQEAAFQYGTLGPEVKRSRPRLPVCAICADLGLKLDRLPARGGGWTCGRGHGPLGGGGG